MARQVDMHPRSFWRWKGAPTSYPQIHKLETWARSIGFQSGTDAEMQEALRRHEEFKKEAKAEVAEATSKRKEAAAEAYDYDGTQFQMKIAEAMARMARGDDD